MSTLFSRSNRAESEYLGSKNDYCIPCIIRFNFEAESSTITPVIAGIIAIRRKKSAIPALFPKKKLIPEPPSADSAPNKPAITPPSVFAIALEMNQNPIKSDAKRTGASLETIDNPTGDKHNSPQVAST